MNTMLILFCLVDYLIYSLAYTYLNILKRSTWNSDTGKSEIGRRDRSWSALAKSPVVILTIPILLDLTETSHCEKINIKASSTE